MTSVRELQAAENAAIEAGTHQPAVDDFGNQYLAATPAPAGLPWAANGLAALDHLDSLYYADGLTVADYRAATDAIRATLDAAAPAPAGLIMLTTPPPDAPATGVNYVRPGTITSRQTRKAANRAPAGLDVERCPGCYQNWRGDWWCDNCDQWPCDCLAESREGEEGS